MATFCFRWEKPKNPFGYYSGQDSHRRGSRGKPKKYVRELLELRLRGLDHNKELAIQHCNQLFEIDP
ncbi:hypothetical protein SCA6_005409 [Theobroma cacao]